MPPRFTYQIEVSHAGLNKYCLVKATTKNELKKKTEALEAQWEDQWKKKLERDKRVKEQLHKRLERERQIRSDEESQAYALERTQQAEELQLEMDNILLNSLEYVGFDISSLKKFTTYSVPPPSKPMLSSVPVCPNRSDAKYNPTVPLFTRLSKKKKFNFINYHTFKYTQDYTDWEISKESIEAFNKKLLDQYNSSVEQWSADKKTFEKKQKDENHEIDVLFESFQAGESDAVERFFSLAIDSLEYPFDYDNSIDFEYNSLGKVLIVDLFFPIIEDIPNLKNVSFIKTRKEFKESYHTEAYMKKKYESVLYQIVLSFLNFIFSNSDRYNIIDSIVLNGKIKTIDKTTGKSIDPYILSVNVSRVSFQNLNLKAIDPKSWFKSAKGVSAASLTNITPVAPIVLMSREDKRFVEGYIVSNDLDDSLNLAAIDWQDFEHLIREIFEREFNTNGGEVKITQASRDGGVDAVAFDPDPIRGGKIVIQAKRYTNVVGVSAVRDLYGTILNEGATKGILVTTSNYGNDAYSFAQGKPITLMNGANLLYLLEKHGFRAKIDLKEAKDMLRG